MLMARGEEGIDFADHDTLVGQSHPGDAPRPIF
jgi:hypothetical protein